MLQDKDEPIKHMSMYSYLQKRILNVKSPQKRQGPRPERSSSTKRHHIDFSPSDQGEDYDADSSGGSTILLPPGSSSEDDSSDWPGITRLCRRCTRNQNPTKMLSARSLTSSFKQEEPSLTVTF